MPEANPLDIWPLRGWLERIWYSRRVPWLLRPLAGVFGGSVKLRRWAYQQGLLSSGHPGVPVVVVGNLTVGGAGKTPFVLWLAEQLRANGIRVGIAMRGFGGSARRPEFVTSASSPGDVGDEAVLLARRLGCPICVAANRLVAARRLAAVGCQLVISDDGLQHLALQRDLEIAIVDASRGLGNGALLPAGPLREPPERLVTVDFVVINGHPSPLAAETEAPLFMSLQPEQLVALCGTQRCPVTDFRDRPVHAVAGIGHPQRFFELLREQALRPIEHAFADHHPFTASDLAFPGSEPIVMTEKDAVKCTAFATRRMWYLPVSVRVSEADTARLLNAVRACMSGGGR